MRALLRKDAVWLIFLAVDGLVGGLMAMTSVDGAGIWYRPDDQYGPGSLVFLFIAGGVLGLCAGLFEDATFTREYLLHRPVSRARLFWTRQLGCALVLVTWVVVTPALHLAGALLISPDAPRMEPARYWQMLNQGAVGVAFYAVALFAATLVRRWLLAVIIATALSTAILFFFAISLYGGSTGTLRHQLQAPVAFALALPMLLAALRISSEGRDLDRPVSRARLTAAAGALMVFSLAGSAFLHVLQLDARRSIIDNYPKLARLPDGSAILVGTKSYSAPFRVDDRHRRIEGSVAKAEYAFEGGRGDRQLRPRIKSLGEGGALRHGVRYRPLSCNIKARCYAGSDGRVHVYGYEGGDDPVMVKHVGKADGSTFSRQAQPLGYWGGAALMADPADGGVWRYDFEAEGPGFVRIALPGGDRFIEDVSPLVNVRNKSTLFSVYEVVVRGERGVYVAARDGFQPAPPEIRAAVDELDRRRRRPDPIVELYGPVRYQVTLPASGSEPAFSHSFAPQTLQEKALNLQMQALSLVRAPVVTAASLLLPRTKGLGNPTDNDGRILFDPLVLLGSGWALGLNLLLGAVLAGLTFRRLGRLGVPGPRRGLWTALVGAFGVIGYLVYRATENNRAWQPLEATQIRPPLLIRSAA